MGEFAQLQWPDAPQWVWGLVFWLGAIAFGLAVIWGVWPLFSSSSTSGPALSFRPMWNLKLEKKHNWPFTKFMSLKAAGEYAYGRLHGSMIADVAEHPFSNKPADPVRYILLHMVSTLRIPLYGCKPFSGKLEEIREEYIKWHELSDDFSRLINKDRAGNGAVYENLKIKQSDVHKYVKEQKDKKWPEENI